MVVSRDTLRRMMSDTYQRLESVDRDMGVLRRNEGHLRRLVAEAVSLPWWSRRRRAARRALRGYLDVS